MILTFSLVFWSCAKKQIEPLEFKTSKIFVDCPMPSAPVFEELRYNTQDELYSALKARFTLMKIYVKDLIACIECFKAQTK